MNIRIWRKKIPLPIVIFFISATTYALYVWIYDRHASKLEELDTIRDFVLTEKMIKNISPKAKKWEGIHADLNSNQLYTDNMDGVSLHEIQRIVGKLAPKDEIVQVHVVPFSHVDPGWLQTYDEYTNSTNQILTSMLQFLPQNPDMTFIWMETVFFAHWWKRINESQRAEVKKLLDNNSLDLLSGSWVMTDEAVAHYWSMIDNFVEGHQYIAEILGQRYIPTSSWSNDPFGHSSTTTYIARLSGLQNFFINRISTTLKLALGKANALEFLWKQPWDRSGKLDAFTHVLQGNHYDILSTCGFDSSVCCRFDFLRIKKYFCGPTVAITPQNVKASAELITSQYRALGSLWPHSHVLVPLGDDFRFMDSEDFNLQYENYKMLMNYINAHSEELKLKIKFSTISNYFKEVNDQFKNDGYKPASLVGDFFPYVDVMETSWTGYYSTRPYQKKMDAILRNVLRAADIISVMVHLKSVADSSSDWLKRVFDKLRSARRKLALFQHHDAITGTSRVHVARDYVEKLKDGISLCNAVIVEAIVYLTGEETLKDLTSADDNVIYERDGRVENVKVIKLSQALKIKRMMIFNSLPYEVTDLIRFVTNRHDILIEDANGELCQYQINPYFHPNGTIDTALYEAQLRVTLRPLAVHNFLIRLTNRTRTSNLAQVFCKKCGSVPKIFKPKPLNQSSVLVMENGIVRTFHDVNTGLLTGIEKLNTDLSNLSINFASYKSTSSGHYVFGPSIPPPEVFDATKADVFMINGPLSHEVHSISRLIYHKARVLKLFNRSSEYLLDFENIVNMSHTVPSDFVMKIHTPFKPANQSFYTDMNGFQIVKRHFAGSSVEKNYYPVASSVSVRDAESKTHLVVLTGQSHGATVHPDGQVEIMIDRTATINDNKGIPEILDHSLPCRTNFRLLLEQKIDEEEYLAHTETIRSHMYAMQNKPLTFVADTKIQDSKHGLRDITLLDSPFPDDIYLINLRQLTKQADFGLILQKFPGHTDQSSIKGILHNMGISNRKFWPCTLSGIKTNNGYKDVDDVTMEAMDLKMLCFR